MVIGWITPSNRKTFAKDPRVVGREPKGPMSHAAYLADLRGTPYGSVPENPTVDSKSTRRYGKNPQSGAIQGSTGVQPVNQVERGLKERSLYAREEKCPDVKVTTADYFGRETPRK
jgi:hypothetical protein